MDFRCDITRIIPINSLSLSLRSPQDIKNHFIIIEMKSKKAKKEEQQELPVYKQFFFFYIFGIIQKEALFHMPFDVKKYFYYFL